MFCQYDKLIAEAETQCPDQVLCSLLTKGQVTYSNNDSNSNSYRDSQIDSDNDNTSKISSYRGKDRQ